MSSDHRSESLKRACWRGGEMLVSALVPGDHGRVVRQTASPGALTRAAADKLRSISGGSRQPAPQIGWVQGGAWSEGSIRGRPGEAPVPRTDLLADVAPKEPFADGTPEVARHAAARFDGQIGDAAPGVNRPVGQDAAVGQASTQRRQDRQRSATNGVSEGRGRSSKTSASSVIDPALGLIRHVFRPIDPRPAR